MNLRTIAYFGFLFFLPLTASAVKFQFPTYLTCQTSSDCVIVDGVCGWEALNRSESGRSIEKKNGADCAIPKTSVKPEAECVSGLCFPVYGKGGDQESECRQLSGSLKQIFFLAASCESDKDCTDSFFDPLYECRTGFNQGYAASQRLTLLNRFHEHCAGIHKSGLEHESRCQDPNWKSSCKRGRCVPQLDR